MANFPNQIQQLKADREWKHIKFDRLVVTAKNKLHEKILRWLGAEIEEAKVEVITYHNLQSADLLQAILTAARDRKKYRDNPSDEITTCIVGTEEWERLTGNEEVKTYLAYNAGPFHYAGSFNIGGVKVVVLPWIKGWAVF